MPTHYQETIHQIDPTVNPAGLEGHLRLQYGTLDHLDPLLFKRETELAKLTEHRQPGYLREAAEAQSMTKDYNYWLPRISEPKAGPDCVVCSDPVHESDHMPGLTIKDLMPGLSEPICKQLTDQWQENPVMSPLPVHIGCIDQPERLSVTDGNFQMWTVRRLSQIQISLDVYR